ncbi:MAG: signal peptidase I [Desulfobacteraceae bacterium]|nr:signal peptidase I [Desulfobacteraceae bacterium]
MTDKPRKPWLACLLTFLTIGLGHLYSGEAKKGAALYFFGQCALLAVLVSLVLLLPNISGFILAVLIGFGFLIFCLFDAVRISRRHKTKYELKKYNRWYFYVLIFVISSFLIEPAVEYVVKKEFVGAYKIPSGGMAPTLKAGDYVFADKFIYSRQEVRRGDIVIFPYPEDPSKAFVKRVVAIGGDTLEIIDKKIFLNGDPQAHDYAIHTDPHILSEKECPRDNFGPVKVPEDMLFVMGDNRDNSYDSRFWGYVKKSSVKGKVKSIYWSWDSEKSAIRWERIGKTRCLD